MQMADKMDISQDNTHFGLNKPLTGGSHSKYLYRLHCELFYYVYMKRIAEILTSPLPHVFAQLGPFLGADALPMGVLTPPKWSKSVPMCLRNLQKKFGAWGPNRC